MTTGRELLEGAAKAAGLDVVWVGETGEGVVMKVPAANAVSVSIAKTMLASNYVECCGAMDMPDGSVLVIRSSAWEGRPRKKSSSWKPKKYGRQA